MYACSFHKVIDPYPCAEFVSHNMDRRLNKLFGNNEKNFNSFNSNNTEVKTNYQKGNILNNNKKNPVWCEEGILENFVLILKRNNLMFCLLIFVYYLKIIRNFNNNY